MKIKPTKMTAIALLGFAIVFLGIASNRGQVRAMLATVPGANQVLKTKTIEEQIQVYGPLARPRLIAAFKAKKLTYPPDKIALVAIKDSRELQIYAGTTLGAYGYVQTYPILGASGNLGPKLREGDKQVPEGLYCIPALEPNTPYHLGLRVNYPNAFDLAHARDDGRDNPGSDILIHGNTGSVGCLAMGDEVSEDLFVLANDAKDHNIPLIISPVDLRTMKAPPSAPADPGWLPQLYAKIKRALAVYPPPAETQ